MKLKSKTRISIAIVILLFIGGMLYRFRHALLPFILAIFLAYILNPVVDWMCSKKFKDFRMPRGLAIILLYICIITGLSFGGTYFFINLAGEVKTLANDIPNIRKSLTEQWVPTVSKQLEEATSFLPDLKSLKFLDENKNLIEEPNAQGEPKPVKDEIVLEYEKNDPNNQVPMDNDMVKFFANTRFEVVQDKKGFVIIPKPNFEEPKKKESFEIDFVKLLNNLISALLANIKDMFINLLSIGQTVIFSVVSSLLTTIIILMITAFMIIDDDRIINYIRGLVPERFRGGTDKFLQKLDTGLGGVVRGQLIISLVNGTLTGIGLFILDIKFALILSIIATVTSLIPIFGVVISSVPIVLMALTNSFLTAVFALLWILGIHFIEGNFLNPKIMGKSAEIHPVLVIFALVLGEKTFGLTGALLAVPLFSMLQTTFLFIIENFFPDESQIPQEFDPSTIKSQL